SQLQFTRDGRCRPMRRSKRVWLTSCVKHTRGKHCTNSTVGSRPATACSMKFCGEPSFEPARVGWGAEYRSGPVSNSDTRKHSRSVPEYSLALSAAFRAASTVGSRSATGHGLARNLFSMHETWKSAKLSASAPACESSERCIAECPWKLRL